MCSVLGLFVRQSDPGLRDASVRVYIANHVTQFDHNVINLLTSCNTVSDTELRGSSASSSLQRSADRAPERRRHRVLRFLFVDPGLRKP